MSFKLPCGFILGGDGKPPSNEALQIKTHCINKNKQLVDRNLRAKSKGYEKAIRGKLNCSHGVMKAKQPWVSEYSQDLKI